MREWMGMGELEREMVGWKLCKNGPGIRNSQKKNEKQDKNF